MSRAHCGHILQIIVLTNVLLSTYAALPAQAKETVSSPIKIKSIHARYDVSPRKFPFPYVAMLAISSDTDGMTPRKFTILHNFLNTHKRTPLGWGLGLDIADSTYFFIGTDRSGACDVDGTTWQDQMSFFHRLSTDEPKDAPAIIAYTKLGWIDSVHSVGDFSLKDKNNTLYHRRFAEAMAQAIKENQLHYTVWINHGNESNVGNFGNTSSKYQQGDLPTSPYYLTDLMIPLGIHYVWTSRDDHFGRSDELYPISLRDGQHIWGFYRYTDDGYTKNGALTWNWNPYQLPLQLSAAHLTQIEHDHQYAIIAQHLGGNADLAPLLDPAIAALRNLAHEYYAGRILVTRTSRLLRYNETQDSLHYTVSHQAQWTNISIGRLKNSVTGSYSPSYQDLRGVTFYTPDPGHTKLFIQSMAVPEFEIIRNAADATGRKSIGFKWWFNAPLLPDFSLPERRAQQLQRSMPFAHKGEIFNWTEDPL